METVTLGDPKEAAKNLEDTINAIISICPKTEELADMVDRCNKAESLGEIAKITNEMLAYAFKSNGFGVQND